MKKWRCFTRASWTKTEYDMQIITSELFCSWVGPTVPPGGWVHLPALELWAVNRRCYKKLVCREQQTAPALRSFFCELELQSGRLVLQVCESCVRNRRFLPTHITSAAACFLYFLASGIETLTSDLLDCVRVVPVIVSG